MQWHWFWFHSQRLRVGRGNMENKIFTFGQTFSWCFVFPFLQLVDSWVDAVTLVESERKGGKLGAAASTPFLFSFVYPPFVPSPNCSSLPAVDNCMDAVTLVEHSGRKREREKERELGGSGGGSLRPFVFVFVFFTQLYFPSHCCSDTGWASSFKEWERKRAGGKWGRQPPPHLASERRKQPL